MEECRIILAEQDNLLTFSKSQDRVKTLFFPTSRMEECRIILAEQDNLLTFSESQDRCHLGLRLLIGSRHLSSRLQGWKSDELS
ncbi:hypothetical protein GQ457_15G030120 [Hibiscus cannabinus]